MKKLACIMSFLVLIIACEKEEDFTPVEQNLQPVQLFLGVEDEEGATKLTPVNDTPGSETAVTIENVWVLQFDAVSGILVSSPVYIDDYVAGSAVDNASSARLNVELGHASTLVFIANTFSSTLNLGEVGKTTLSDFRKKFFDISSQESLFGHSGLNYYQRLSGSTTVNITGALNIGAYNNRLNLKRNVARIRVRIQNSITAEAIAADPSLYLRVIGVQLCSVPSKDYLLFDYSPETLFPKEVNNTFDYPAELFFTGDLPIPGGGVGDTTIQPGQTSQDVYYYVPANQRGKGEVKINDKEKGADSPHGATFLRVYAFDSSMNSYAFIFYLGSNLGGGGSTYPDYNLIPNHTYNYTFQITNDWKTKVSNGDPRINHYKSVYDLTTETERPNCYMLAVPPVVNETYYKIPIEKANMFWKNYGTGADSYPITVRKFGETTFTSDDMVIGDSDNWTVSILWSDFDTRDKIFFPAVDGSGNPVLDGLGKPTEKNNTFSGTGNTSFTIGFGGGDGVMGIQGNVVLCLKKTLPGDLPCIVWSWHLWLTDYEPNQVPASAGSRYVYKVSGGKVIRYNNSEPFMMDRDLGAMYNPYNPSFLSSVGISAGRKDPTIGMYYQYGRKDPFPNDRYLYFGGSSNYETAYPEVSAANAEKTLKNDAVMAKILRSNMESDAEPLMWSPNGRLNVPFSINHPMVYIYVSGRNNDNTWNTGVSGSYEDIFNPSPSNFNANSIWMDPQASSVERSAAGTEWGVNKSVFDPCPAGWKVASDVGQSGSWKTWSGVVSEHKSTASFLNAWGEEQVYGVYLWPQNKPLNVTETDLDRADFYPFAGYLGYTNGEVNNSIDQTNLNNRRAPHWTSKVATPAKNAPFVMYASSLSITANDYTRANSYQAMGYSVRCVKY